MEIMIFCGIYLVELVCYLIGMKVLFRVRLKKKFWIIASQMMFVTLAIVIPGIERVLGGNEAGKNVLITISVIFVIFISIEGSLTEKAIWLVFTFLILECVDGIFTRPCQMIVSNFNIYSIRSLTFLISKFCTLTCIFVLKIVRERMEQYDRIHISSIIYIIIGFIAASMMLCLGFLNYVVNYMDNKRYRFLCSILNVTILISIFLLVVFVIYIKNTHERMEQLLRTEQLLKESQVNYYRQVLKKETDTRKYRHDIMNHLVYIRDILSRNKIDETKKYLDNILGGFQKIQNMYYVSGNEMVDTIMNYFLRMLPKNVKIIIKGRCPVEIEIEDTDMCTIFSNVFQNAVDEITKNNLRNAEIIVGVKKGKQYVEYNIQNTLSKEIDEKRIDKNGLPKSYKSDKRNHGIGMMNVKMAIEKSEGRFKWYQGNNYFCVDIILPIK